MTAEALTEIEAIRTSREFVFQPPNWETNPRRLQFCLKLLEKYAGFEKSRCFGFHGFRKLHATLVADTAPSDLGIKAAQESLGHSTSTVTTNHYVNGRVQDRIVVEAISRLPKFGRKDDPRQTKMF
ncbi:MAG: hypothetical protein QM811_16625 [Pirellulales bacterium]